MPKSLGLAADVQAMSLNGELPVIRSLQRNRSRLRAVFLGTGLGVDCSAVIQGLDDMAYSQPVVLEGDRNVDEPVSVAVSELEKPNQLSRQSLL